jgi:DNA-directed RNA polymerase II subunit RPB1
MKDMMVHEKTRTKVDKIVERATKTLEEIKKQGTVESASFLKKTGVTVREYEQRANKLLNDARKKACEDAFSDLAEDNAFKLMVTAMSKGTPIGPAQMVKCVGQQNVEGKRIPDGFIGRTLPHFKKGDSSPLARGFIKSNYVTGLSPQEVTFIALCFEKTGLFPCDGWERRYF